MSDAIIGAILGILGAALPGVFIALFSNQLDVNREEKRTRQAVANGRMLLTLEVQDNRNALAQFWRTINALDAEHQSDLIKHLAGMAQNGLLAHVLPEWSTARWDHADATWLAGLSAKDVTQLDAFYRDLKTITALYARVATITPQEQQQFSQGGSSARFWYNYFADNRSESFPLLDDAVRRVLASQPLG
jgi:hypothetical protein